MKTYTKTHTNKVAAETHLKKIKNRGGQAILTPAKDGFHIKYSFPEKKKYDVISPDGITIRIGVPPFKTIKAREEYFELWKKRFERQGYYSANNGRIRLEDLSKRCEWIEL